MGYFLTNFHILRPNFEVSQEHTIEWISQIHTQAEAKKQEEGFDEETFHKTMRGLLLRIGAGPGKIATRGVHHPDFQHMAWTESEIFTNGDNPCFGKRTRYYDAEVEKIFERFYPETIPLPDDLIHVSCTGYVSPSGAQKLVSNRKGGHSTTVTHAYHMGCYASIPALRMAKGFAASGNHQIDIVHTELCALHMNPSVHTPEQLVVQTLFADGFIKYTLRSVPSSPSLEVMALKEYLLEGTLDAMSWETESWGLKMGLKKEVPKLIANQLEPLVHPFLDDKNPVLFAIHPGGPKIIDQVATTLNLQPWQVAHSRDILKNYGNMSSASLPHIWEAILSDEAVANGTSIVSLAFGPGLTVAIAHLKKR